MTKGILIHSPWLTTKSPLKVTRVPHVENVAPSRRQQRTKWADACEVFRTDPTLRKLGCTDAPASPLFPFSPARLTAARLGRPCLTPNPEGFNLPFAREMAKSLSNADFFSRMHFQLSTDVSIGMIVGTWNSMGLKIEPLTFLTLSLCPPLPLLSSAFISDIAIYA